MNEIERGKSPDLGAMACLSGWVTPTTRDHKDTPGMVAQRDGRDRVDQLPRQAYLAGWQTPSVDSFRKRGHDRTDELGNQEQLKNLSCPARLTASGQMLTGSAAGMDVGGQLNAAFSRWLQGYPKEWDEAAIEAFRSMPTPRRKAASTGSVATETPSI